MGFKLGHMDITWEKVGRLLREPRYAGRVVSGNLARARHQLAHGEAQRAMEQGIAAFPRSVTLSLTYRCNLRCKMCNLWGENGMLLTPEGKDKASPKADLTFEQVLGVYEQIKDRSERLYIFGGEPMLHNRFEDILKAMTPGRVRATLETNGLLVHKMPDAILDSIIDSINISIDGPPAIHDEIRGMKGAFEKSLEGARILARKAKERGKPFSVGIRFIVTDDNYDRMYEFAELMRDEPIDALLFQHLMYQHEQVWRDQIAFSKQHFNMDVGWDRSMPPPPRRIDPKVVVEQLHRMREAGYPFRVTINPAYPEADMTDYYRASEFMPAPTMDCGIIWEHISIDSRGEVMLCTTVSAGHIDEQPVEGIWNGERYRQLRTVVRREKHMPYCKICCYLGDKQPFAMDAPEQEEAAATQS